jgi:hypothetical protein
MTERVLRCKAHGARNERCVLDAPMQDLFLLERPWLCEPLPRERWRHMVLGATATEEPIDSKPGNDRPRVIRRLVVSGSVRRAPHVETDLVQVVDVLSCCIVENRVLAC